MSTTLVCDNCKDRSKEAKRADLWTGRMLTDAAGGPSTQEINVRDLCHDCAIAALERCAQRHKQ